MGTIGRYGCVLSTAASIAKLAGFDTDPLRLNRDFIDQNIYVKDPTGTLDFLPDGALARHKSKRFKWEGTYPGLNTTKIDQALPTPDVYVELHISTHAVPTHRVYVWSGSHGNYQIDDPWGPLNSMSSVVHSLSHYGDPRVAVKKTILIRAITPALKPEVKEVVQPPEPPAPETPDPLIPDEPEMLYRFVLQGDVETEPPPEDQVTQESVAKTIANDWVADKPRGTVLRVLDAEGKLVHQAAAIGIPLTG